MLFTYAILTSIGFAAGYFFRKLTHPEFWPEFIAHPTQGSSSAKNAAFDEQIVSNQLNKIREIALNKQIDAMKSEEKFNQFFDELKQIEKLSSAVEKNLFKKEVVFEPIPTSTNVEPSLNEKILPFRRDK